MTLTKKDIARINAQGKALVKVVFEKKLGQAVENIADYVLIKRAMNNTGIIVKSYPGIEYKGLRVLNFSIIQPGVNLIVQHECKCCGAAKRFVIYSPVKSFEYIIPKKK